ncbi:MAG: hypothetical protein AAFZ15_06835 [Bacteroidota bacterium]
MTRMTFLFVIIVLAVSCGDENHHTSKSNPSTEQGQDIGKNNKDQTTETDGEGANNQQTPEMIAAVEEQRKKSYLKLITGKWQANMDRSWILEITGNILKQSRKSVPPSSEEFTIQINCNEGECTSDHSWCITTKQDCFIVKSVDAKFLYLQLPNTVGTIKFNRL